MKKYNSIQSKLYIFIILLGFLLGWNFPRATNVNIEGTVTEFESSFNYALFSITLFVGFSLLLIYDAFIYFKERNN